MGTWMTSLGHSEAGPTSTLQFVASAGLDVFVAQLRDGRCSEADLGSSRVGGWAAEHIEHDVDGWQVRGDHRAV